MRLAVVAGDTLRVFDDREEVARFGTGGNLLTESLVEQARVASFAPPVIVHYPRFGLLGQPSPYTYGAT